MLLAAAALAAQPARAQSQTQVGNFLATAIPIGTFGTELYLGDRKGAMQMGLTFAATAGSTELLKRVTHVERPDGSNDLSFPSGHAASAFSAAAYVRQRHGFAAATPLYAAGLYVGQTRVAAHKHRWGDIAGAAAIAEISAALLVKPKQDGRVDLSLDLGAGYIGATVAAEW